MNPMNWDAWVFSAKLAWHRPILRWTALMTLAIAVVGAAVFYYKVIPPRRHAGTAIIHYNIYLGIDDVRAWPWIFLFPSVWLLVSLVDLLVAFGYYHHDPFLSSSLIYLAFLSALPCAGALLYLARMNV